MIWKIAFWALVYIAGGWSMENIIGAEEPVIYATFGAVLGGVLVSIFYEDWS